MNINAKQLLKEIANNIGENIKELDFKIWIENGLIELNTTNTQLKILSHSEEETTFEGNWRDINITWVFAFTKGGACVKLSVAGKSALLCNKIGSLILRYEPDVEDVGEWFVPTCGMEVTNVGMFQVKDIENTMPDTLFRGAFPNSTDKGIFVGTWLPQKNVHLYDVKRMGKSELELSCYTIFTEGQTESSLAISEETWVSAIYDIRTAIKKYSTHIPLMDKRVIPLVGWNSWDYYFAAITMEDIIENMEAILRDPILSKQVETIVVDMGWQHCEGEWYSNYRFPRELERITHEIKSRGFIPGIWTAPILVQPLSTTALRKSEVLIKNKNGDPQSDSNMYMIDPTHPEGREYLRDIYSRLYSAGFRVFKVDFVDCLTRANTFYEKKKGPYEALRDLFSLIRECVTNESHIIGCSLPAECGPWIADSGRIGIDIHNQWSHVEWAVEFMQQYYWMNNRIWVNDPDFMVVRGLETSIEKETNVMNPEANNPNQSSAFLRRWRRGPVFNNIEAETWANFVLMSGGNIVLSDRISMLNEKGMNLLHKYLEPTGISAEPLDLCGSSRAAIWLMELKDEFRLMLVNWSEKEEVKKFKFEEYSLNAPKTVGNFLGEEISSDNGVIQVLLKPHQSIIVRWPK